ncbi:sigma-70 family RNA polymerase sigma factor [Streptomyces sparsogenes]|uniref:sigma-70 family RNA polymerase sigma factor n=1 Tax=Streptomyces sparsogenes TaxID=67365 RepID=UPI00384FD1EF
MPPAYWAFHDLYYDPYFEYTHVHLGTEKAAEELVDGIFVFIGLHWQHITAQENVGAYAWALLKERVAFELLLQGRNPAATEPLAFECAIRAATGPILDAFRDQFRKEFTLSEQELAFSEQISDLDDTMRLFAAMARLPERQFDVMVLHYALDFSTKTTALVMGVCEATVRSTRRTAKRRLAAELGLAMDEDVDDEE